MFIKDWKQKEEKICLGISYSYDPIDFKSKPSEHNIKLDFEVDRENIE